jgi:hypothetical protein
MTLLLNPQLEALEVARREASTSAHGGDEVTVDDLDDHWEFEFVPQGDWLGGGARVWIAKEGFRVLRIVRGQ